MVIVLLRFCKSVTLCVSYGCRQSSHSGVVCRGHHFSRGGGFLLQRAACVCVCRAGWGARGRGWGRGRGDSHTWGAATADWVTLSGHLEVGIQQSTINITYLLRGFSRPWPAVCRGSP